MGRRFLLTSLWIAGLVAWTGAIALAAEGEGADLEAVIRELRAENPELSESEARELAGLAVQDVREREGAAARNLAGGDTTERAGIIVQGPGNLGAPEPRGDYFGGGPRFEMTPEEQAVADRVGARTEQLKGEGFSDKEIESVLRSEFEKEFSQFEGHEGYYKEKQGPQDPREIQYPWRESEQGYPAAGERDDARLRELYQEGRPVGEALQHERGEFGGERHTPEQIERYREMEHGGTFEREHMERSYESPTHETVERPTYEREYTAPEPVERPTYEREYTAPEPVEQPTHETERPEGMPAY